MSQFYANFKKNEAEREAKKSMTANGSGYVKVGFFGVSKVKGARVKRMTKSGDQAVVRINYNDDPNELLGARLHAAGDGVHIQNRPFQKVACLESAGCPLCSAIAEGNRAFGKATTRVFIPMVISYRLPDGTYTEAEPVVMDAAAYMVNDLVNLMQDFGKLKDHVFKLTRNGVGTDTRYSLSYVPTLDNENIVSKAALIAFTNFEISKHSYWIKSAEDMNTFLQTGAFPDVVLSSKTTDGATVDSEAPTQQAFNFPDAQDTPFVNPAPAQPINTATVQASATSNRQPAFQANDPSKDFDFSANW